MNPLISCKRDVLLLGYEDEENLGLRYIAAYLKENGVSVEIIPLRSLERDLLLNKILISEPKIIGFSMIFQRMLPEFADLISFLRHREVQCHFTMGGHYPSIEYKKTLDLIPGLDTIVRHEGELSLLELCRNIDDPGRWTRVKGIVFRSTEGIKLTDARPLVENLDSLPFPLRDCQARDHRGLKVSSLIASRGCYHNCSFCSIQEFYREAPGQRRRSRSPENVIKEMRDLFESGTRIFIFKDDDFDMITSSQKRWIGLFADGLKRSHLADNILWRISCRVDELDYEMVKLLKDVGLEFLYLGIESGSDHGLKTFNKHYKVNDVYRAIEILENAGMDYEYGFMMFDPDSTFSSIKESMSLLRELGRGGKRVIHFTKMFPYAGTSIHQRLENEGRLQGSLDSPNYKYLDPKMDLLEAFFSLAFYDMLFDDQGLVNRLLSAKFDSIILERFFEESYDCERYKKDVRRLTELCNESMIETMELSIDFMMDRSPGEIVNEWQQLQHLADQEISMQNAISYKLGQVIPDTL